MRPRAARTIVAVVLALTAVCVATVAIGCGSEPAQKPLTIAIVGPKSGPLAARAADMRRAAELELDAINSRAAGHPLRLVDGPDPDAIATVVLPGAKAKLADRGLAVELTPPKRRSIRAGGIRAERRPTIWLVPPQRSAERVTGDYRSSGADRAAGARTDDPEIPGTPGGRYVTAALSEHSYPPAGSAFFKKFAEQYDRAPDRWAIYSYEAVGLIVDAISRLQADDRELTRQSVAAQALAIRNRFGPVGHYDILPSGQSTLYVFQARGAGADVDDPASLLESLR